MFQSITRLFFPEVCAGCRSIMPDNVKVICAHCRHEIPLTYHHLNLENEAYKKFYGKVPIDFAVTYAYFRKTGIVREMIHSLKYRGNEAIGNLMGHLLSEDLKDLPGLATVDQIIPVPLHPKKLKQRGYNQVTTFGKCLSENLNIPYNDKILKRLVYSKTQTKKNLLGRTDLQKKNIFAASFDSSAHHQHFLLIDDVLTTGSTLEACSRALLEIPGAKISIVCMAMSN